MPNRFVQRDGSVVELLTRVPVDKGSLLKSLDNLLKTIETSENAVMIPTLLKDKVRVDACELLFVAKILKASILGHSDLVEFYMNHIGHTSSSLQLPSNGLVHAPHHQLQSPTAAAELPSPSIRLQPSPMASPLLAHAISNHQREQQAAAAAAIAASQTQHEQQAPPSTCSSLSSVSSTQSSASTTTATQVNENASTTNGCQSSSSGSGWLTAQQSIGSSSSTGGSFSSTTSGGGNELTSRLSSETTSEFVELAAEEAAANASKTQATGQARQAQPPSLLQLTTTNNHLNSMSDLLAQNAIGQSLEQLTSQLAAMQSGPQVNGGFTAPPSGPLEGLSISTAAANLSLLEQFGSAANTPITTTPPSIMTQHLINGHGPVGTQAALAQPAAPAPHAGRQELRSSRSAGCLFRANSGASSPRTPNQTTPSTPYPQAETLAPGAPSSTGLVGDPSSLVKLLLQVEQLKASISHCTTLLDSVVELYKKSIDNIA